MIGEELRNLRERWGLTQGDMAARLNELTGRRYDKAKISRWETEREKIPRDIEGTLLIASLEQSRAAESGRPLITAVVLQKGGVGKTACAVNLAYVLARTGSRTLLVDADPQGNATLLCGVSEEQVVQLTNAGRSHYHALIGKTPVDEVILETAVPNLHLLPSSIALATAEGDLHREGLNPAAFMREMLGSLAGRYDHIILDCAPTLGMVTLNALTAADLLLIPCQVEAHAIIGLKHLQDTIDKVKRRSNPGLRILGIVPTLFNARLSQDQASLADIQSLWGGKYKVYDPIPRATIYSQAAAASQITLAADPGAPGLEVFLGMARDLMGIVTAGKEAVHGA
jgi:chromosome partitioning protein